MESLQVDIESVLANVKQQRNSALDESAAAMAAVAVLQEQLEAKDEEIARLNRLVAKNDHVGDSGL